MDFVVNHQTPVLLVEQREVRKLLRLVGAVRDDLISRQGDRGNGLGFSSIFGNLVVGQIGLVQDFAVPLLDSSNTRGQDKGRTLDLGHGRDANNRFARAARQHDDAAAPAQSPPA